MHLCYMQAGATGSTTDRQATRTKPPPGGAAHLVPLCYLLFACGGVEFGTPLECLRTEAFAIVPLIVGVFQPMDALQIRAFAVH